MLDELRVAYEYIEIVPLDKKIFIQVRTSLTDSEALQKYIEKVKRKLEDQTNYKLYAFDISASGSDVVVGDNYTLSPTTDLQKNITQLAHALTEKEKYKVIGFSYKEKPLTFEIRTSASAKDQSHSQQLEEIIHAYFQSPDVVTSLKGETYEVIIYSKDEKRIN
ncbi:hypothetical protein DX933_07505 [Ornithinibacillus gellani]|uniref:hypothetical protein n=1 Tax=Ornithinibacillus gellani TaxID=2293253 RepID=UPI000F467B6B|nr:hypothetical protein [Ornithinibacillus gellani]TQS75242.1 hypothetical protein DX933_07505 [Ornithinibacillus gellani]